MADIDWNNEPYITGLQLIQMHSHERAWFENQPNIWRPLGANIDALHNCAHPDNQELVMMDLIRQAQTHG